MRQIALLLIPAAFATAVLAEPLTRLVYERGEFGAASTDEVSEALFWFSFSLAFSGANLLMTRTFFSLRRPWFPTALAGMSLLVNTGVSAALYGPLGIGGIVIGTVAGSAAMTVAQAYLPAPPAQRLRDRPHAPRRRRHAGRRGGARPRSRLRCGTCSTAPSGARCSRSSRR